MADVVAYEPGELEELRERIERRFTLKDLRDFAKIRDLSADEVNALHELERLEFLLKS